MEKYPLTWPAGYDRTPAYKRDKSNFDQTHPKAVQFLFNEILRMQGRQGTYRSGYDATPEGIILSTNLKLRKDGMGLLAGELDRKQEDPGVAVYFKFKGKQVALACDSYLSVWENAYAIGQVIEGIRRSERHRIPGFIERAFTGFTALPPIGYMPAWWTVLELNQEPSEFGDAEHQYKILSKKYHPDNLQTGDEESFKLVQMAFEKAKFRFGKD